MRQRDERRYFEMPARRAGAILLAAWLTSIIFMFVGCIGN